MTALEAHARDAARREMQAGAFTCGADRTPPGGVPSPCLANVHLHRLDRQWADRGRGVLVRYADDLVVLWHSRQEAERVLAALAAIPAELTLALKQAKARIVRPKGRSERLDGPRRPPPLRAREHAALAEAVLTHSLALHKRSWRRLEGGCLPIPDRLGLINLMDPSSRPDQTRRGDPDAECPR